MSVQVELSRQINISIMGYKQIITDFFFKKQILLCKSKDKLKFIIFLSESNKLNLPAGTMR